MASKIHLVSQLPEGDPSRFRPVRSVLKGVFQDEGRGVRVRRTIGALRGMSTFDPFLLFDEASVKKPAGFPSHPHRGFETVSYLLAGAFEHRDSRGNVGSLAPGDVQWMTAGRGIVHSELPAGDVESRGLQLWVNLPAKYKMMEPRYQDRKSAEIPVVRVADGGDIRIVSGTTHGVDATIETITPVHYLDVKVVPGKSMVLRVQRGWNAFAYVLDGSGRIQREHPMSAGQVVIFDNNDATNKGSPVRTGDGDQSGSLDSIIVENTESATELRFLLISGEPIGEPVARSGPFVMNTDAEIRTAFEDYYSGKLA